MAKQLEILYAAVDDLLLDPINPRLGRRHASERLKQDEVLDLMSDWTLNELAESFLINGFWPQEALIVVKEDWYGKKASLVVVEGNRRLAALKSLKKAINGKPASKYWSELVKATPPSNALLESVPYIEVASRDEVAAYLGFRHVTGIKEWKPAEKAEYIASLIDKHKLTYEEVRKKIGSKTPAVRQHYIAYKLLLQMEQQDGVAIERVEEKFSVLYLSLRTQGVQKYLGIDLQAGPKQAELPVAEDSREKLVNFSRWLFGDEKREPLFTDSRNVDTFGKILSSDDGVEYLERTANPSFELAVRKAGVGEEELISLIQGAADNIQLALTDVHVHKRSSTLSRAVIRLGMDFRALLNHFPSARSEVIKGLQDDAGGS